MPAPSLTEYGKLSNLRLIRHYQIHQKWYIQQACVVVTNAKYAVSVATKATSGIPYIFTPDEVGAMLRTWLMYNPQWQKVLQSKPNLPQSQYDLLTDAMARYVAYDAYHVIIA